MVMCAVARWDALVGVSSRGIGSVIDVVCVGWWLR